MTRSLFARQLIAIFLVQVEMVAQLAESAGHATRGFGVHDAKCRREGLCEFAMCFDDCCQLRNGVPKCYHRNGTEYCPEDFPIKRLGELPVCSLDGNTFSHPYKLAQASCLQNKPTGIKHTGECGRGEKFDECSTEGLCAEAECCCHLFNGVPRCYHFGSWFCPTLTFVSTIRPNEQCGSNGEIYQYTSQRLMDSCLSNKPIYATDMEICKRAAEFRPLGDFLLAGRAGNLK